ncbi:MAG: NUDIX domain-containing protein [Hyphomicrobiales bacterium]
MFTSQDIRIAVDAVVFGYKEKQLYIVLIKQKFGVYRDRWSLPGGFVLNGEGLKDAIIRELQEETGITTSYLEQLYTFGDDVNRDERAQVVSVAYFGLVNPSKLDLSASTDAQDVAWFPVNEIPELPFDHNEIINKAIQRLKGKLNYEPIGFDLLDEKFPFPSLEQLYQTILDKEIDRRNFRKKMLSFGILNETDEKVSIGGGRPAKLYTFNKEKYEELLKEKFVFDIKFV